MISVPLDTVVFASVAGWIAFCIIVAIADELIRRFVKRKKQ